MNIIFYATFLRFWRNKIWQLWVFVVVVVILLWLLLKWLVLTEFSKVFVDYVFALLEYSALWFVLIFGSNLFGEDKNNKTLDLVWVNKPSALDIVIGKYLGVMGMLLVYFLLILFVFFIIGGIFWIDISFVSFVAMFAIYIKMWVVLSLLMLLDGFISKILVIFVWLSVYFLWHSMDFLAYYAHKTGYLEYLINILYYIIPFFGQMNLQNIMFAISASHSGVLYWLWLFGYNIIYIFLLLFINIRLYKKRLYM